MLTPIRLSLSLFALVGLSGFGLVNGAKAQGLADGASQQVAQVVPVVVGVNWGQSTGKKATALSYGLNGFQLFSPKVVGLGTYRENLTAMRPGIVRYHNSQMMNDARSDDYGWLLDSTAATYRWDRNKIAQAMARPLSYQPTVMMNIPEWPKYLSDSTEKLKPENYQAFAAFCADLVRVVNVEQNRGVKYWEVLNERDSLYRDNPAELGQIYSVAAQAMRQVDPTIKVGGPALRSPYDKPMIEGFLSTAHSQLDFLSYHTYVTGQKDNSNQALFQLAMNLGSETAGVRGLVAKYTTRSVEIFHDEFNISYAPPDARMTNQTSAVFDALGLMAIAKSGATGAMAWNESDGWYGKLNNSWGNWSKRPAAYVFQLFNHHLRGEIVQTQSSYDGVVAYGVKGDLNYGLVLVNRSGSDQIVQLQLGGWAGMLGGSDIVTMYHVSEVGLTTGSATLGQLGGGYRLPKDGVVVMRRDR